MIHACPHCGEVTITPNELGESVLLYLLKHDQDNRTKDGNLRAVTIKGIIAGLETTVASTYKAVSALAGSKLVTSPGGIQGIRSKVAYYTLTDKGREVAKRLQMARVRP
jgi:hypothetical protein